ncbi:MAG: penicillin-binding protein 2 [Rickettsiales bacterium]|nr:penicillin-binding protein 2 [Rickettsiales bacterium]
MLRDIRKNKVFNRRALLVGLAQGSLASILVMRLGYLQLFKHNDYAMQSDSNRIKPTINPSPRGVIYDRNNVALTRNDSSYRLLLYLDRKSNKEKLVDDLARVLDLSEQKKDAFLKKINSAGRKRVISLMDHLDWDDLARVESNLYALSGVGIESGIIRKYPYPHETAHIIGYVSSPSENEIEGSQSSLFMHPDFRVGKSGIERSFDGSLRGKYGVNYTEVNSLDLPIRVLSKDKPINGRPLQLTIDLELQAFVTNRIKDLSASVVVMDVNGGEILASVSSPSFNPNNFVEGVSKEYWREVSEDERKPLHNKPISALYPPGSTFKIMVALAALEEGLNPLETVVCRGHYRLGRRRFHCWKEEGHGRVNMHSAIAQSCNTYFYDLANKLGNKPIVNMAQKFGYGQEFDIGLSGMRSGILPDDNWKEKANKGQWVGGDTLNLAIGQGYLSANPLQMAVAVSRIANGGKKVRPCLIKNNQKINEAALGVSSKHIDFVRNAMSDVVNHKRGTAYWARTRIKDFAMAGKTGTSQVISKRESEMTEKENEKNANHAIFMGFAPVTDPKYAISVVVEHGGSGSVAAAPVARDIFKKIAGQV